MPRLLACVVFIASVLSFFADSGHGAPVVTIRDRIEVELFGVQRVDGGVLIRGRLLEQSTHSGAPGLFVRIRLNDAEFSQVTSATGHFSQYVAQARGNSILSVDFDGDSFFDAAHLEVRNFDISKAPVELSLTTPETLRDVSGPVVVQVRSNSGDKPIAVPVDLYLGESPATKVLSVSTDNNGRASVALEIDAFVGPGSHRLEARFVGNENFDAAQTSAVITIISTTEVTLEVKNTSVPQGSALVARGELLDSSNKPLSGQTLSLELDGERIASAKTNAAGTYRFNVDTTDLSLGSVTAQVIFAPNQRSLSPSRSPIFEIRIQEPKPVPLAYTLGTFAATGLALLSFVALRTRPWEGWLQQTKARKRSRAPSPSPKELAQGLVPSRPPRHIEGHAQFTDLRATICDAVQNSAIPNATVWGRDAVAVAWPVTSDARGRIHLELAKGSHSLRVAAHGFVTEAVEVTIPHKGELHDATIRLMPVREKIFSLYKQAAEDLLPEAGLWGIWTPRQILDHVRRKQSSEALHQLTDFVERTFFAKEVATEDLVSVARKLVKAVAPKPSNEGRSNTNP